MKIVAIVPAALLLSGCSHFAEIMNENPVTVENLNAENNKPVLTVVALSAQKRAVLVSTNGNHVGEYCAEPPPEVAMAYDSDHSKSLTASDKTASGNNPELNAAITDKVNEAVTQLSQRTDLLDIYRTGVYSLCQFYVNGALDPNALKEGFTTLTSSVLDAYITAEKNKAQDASQQKKAQDSSQQVKTQSDSQQANATTNGQQGNAKGGTKTASDSRVKLEAQIK